LADLTEEDDVRFGAKAGSLARLMRWGFPVPDGFALAFAGDGPLELTESDRASIRDACAALGERSTHGSIPQGTRTPVAVRSSAADEDRAEASFAGQHETFLNVVGDAALLEAVSSCVASRDSPRAASYRRELGRASGAMGVVVQVMVPAEYAGVCFTRSPVSEEEIVIELVRGLGAELVAGRKRPGRIALRRATGDACSVDDAEGLVDAFGLSHVHALGRLALDAERRFGFPLDIEWVWAEGRPYLLQARPVTAIGGAAERERIRREEIARLRAQAGGSLVVWTDFSVADMLPNPSPLTVEILQRAARFDGGIGRSWRRIGFRYARSGASDRQFETIGGRVFLDLSAIVRASNDDLPLVLDSRRLRAGHFSAGAPPLRLGWVGWRRALASPYALLRWLLVVPHRFFALRRAFHRDFAETILPALRAEAAALRARDLASLSLSGLWGLFHSHIERLTGELVYYHQLSDIFAFGTYWLLGRSLRRVYGERAEEMAIRLTTGLPGNFNTETNLALARVAGGELGLDRFLEDYGHRGNPDWEIAAPRWRETPERVRRMADAIARSGADPARRFEQQERVREEAERRFAADVRAHRWLRPWHDAILGDLRHYQRYSPLRETTQSACYLWVELGRRVLVEAGRRTGAGDLLFHLSLDELRRLLVEPADGDAIERARERRRQLRLARTLYVPHVVSSDDLEVVGRPPELDPSVRTLHGHVASLGTVRGRARVVQTLDEAENLEPGEILVAASTDPAWTPLFLVASGLVLEQGGLLSHGAIVAREYGLPALVGVPHATRLIQTGERITLDATNGQVAIGGA
jgi:pyruvate,water dikinase